MQKVFRGVSDTSKRSYRQLKADGTDKIQREQVYQCLLANGPLNSRQLSDKTGFERTAITRAVFDLETLQKIYVSGKFKCKITGRIVRFYSAVPETVLPEPVKE